MTKLYFPQISPVITIDGPGATGKGTISHMLANYLNWNFLDSGVIYRVLALAAIENDVNLQNSSQLVQLAHDLNIEFIVPEIGKTPRLMLAGADVSEAIRTEQCGSGASQIGALPAVREALLSRQRAFKKPPGLVTDGRDMGTVVFPDAVLKFFLTASQEERAKRRYNQLKQQGIHVSLHDVLEDLSSRDQRDQTRTVAPLKPAADAIIIDTTALNVGQVFDEIVQHVVEKFGKEE